MIQRRSVVYKDDTDEAVNLERPVLYKKLKRAKKKVEQLESEVDKVNQSFNRMEKGVPARKMVFSRRNGHGSKSVEKVFAEGPKKPDEESFIAKA